MDSQSWSELEKLYHEAAALDPDRHEEFLQAQSLSVTIERELRALLGARARAQDFLEKPAVDSIPEERPPQADRPSQHANKTLPKSVGKYSVEAEIGRGGMGIVYLATDPDLDRCVALKLVRDELALDPARLRQVAREARLLSAIQHPNIAMVHSLEEEDGQPFFTMEWIPGRSLARVLDDGPLKPARVRSIAVQVARALEAAHRAGITHSDLKPGNIMLTDEDVVKVLDFSLARTQDPPIRGTQLGGAKTGTTEPDSVDLLRVTGTPGYMSPEQLRGQSPDHRVDVWALGCTVYECLTGQRLIRGSTTDELITETLNFEPDWSALPADTPAVLRQLLEDCSAPDPATRVSDVATVRRQLEKEIGFAPVRLAGELLDPEPTAAENLPLSLTSFVGREVELAELDELLGQHRLVTLLGVGGTGKTRLALEAARRLDGAVCWVDLANTPEADLVVPAVARALDASASQDRSDVTFLVELLGAKPGTLILDNCEHLLDECASLVGEVLKSCPATRFLTTSRERLAVPGERPYAVPLLAVPESDTLELEALADVETVRLFLDRAVEADPDFRLTTRNRESVVRICRRLEGHPLAVELAASRVRVLSTRQIEEMLVDRFRLLRGQRNLDMPRHETLQATMDWSYELLMPSERALFRRLCVFSGDFGLDAAEQVCVGPDVASWEVLDLLTRLVDKSLVLVDFRTARAAQQPRYRLLDTVKELAVLRAREADELQGIVERHFDFFLEFGAEAAHELKCDDRGKWAERIDRDLENFAVALLPRHGEIDLESRMVLASHMVGYWFNFNWRRGRLLLDELVIGVDPTWSHPAHSNVRAVLGRLYTYLGDYDTAQKHFRIMEAICAESGDLHQQSRVANEMALVHFQQGDLDNARLHMEKSLVIRREEGKPAHISIALSNLAVVVRTAGDFIEARKLAEEAKQFGRDCGNTQRECEAGNGLGMISLELGDYPAAIQQFEACLEMATRVAMPHLQALAGQNLGTVFREQGRYADSIPKLEAASAFREEIGDLRRTSWIYEELAAAYLAVGDLVKSEHALSISAERGKSRNDAEKGVWQDFVRSQQAVHRGELEPALEMLDRAGSKVKDQSRTWLAFVLVQEGKILRQLADFETAEKRLDASQALLSELSSTRFLDAVWNERGLLLLDQGLPMRAEPAFREALTIAEQSGSVLGQAWAHRGLGLCASPEDSHHSCNFASNPASNHLGRAIELAAASGHVGAMASVYLAAARSIGKESPRLAAEFMGAAQAIPERTGRVLVPTEQRWLAELRVALGEALGASVFDELVQVGSARSPKELATAWFAAWSKPRS